MERRQLELPYIHCAFYEEGERDPGRMFAQGAIPYVPFIGSKVSLSDGKQIGYYWVTDVLFGANVDFQAAIVEFSDRIESGGERPPLKTENGVSIFVKRCEDVFDRVPVGFPV